MQILHVSPNQMTTSEMVKQYWHCGDIFNSDVWITIFIIVIVLINIFGVKVFGEFEFWLSCLKVLITLGLIILLFVIMLGGDAKYETLGFRCWKDPGIRKRYTGISNKSLGKFVPFVSFLVTAAVLAYSGIGLVGITISETENPHCSIPMAIKLIFY